MHYPGAVSFPVDREWRIQTAVDASTEGFLRELDAGWSNVFVVKRAVFDFVSLKAQLKAERGFSVQSKPSRGAWPIFGAGVLSLPQYGTGGIPNELIGLVISWC